MSRSVVTYRRVSTEEQGSSGLGLDAQAAVIGQELERRGWIAASEHCEVASGRSMRKRPVLAEAVGEARRLGGVLVVAKLDRLSRDVRDVLRLLDQAEAEGWAVLMLDVQADTTTAAGRFIVTVMAAGAEMERRLIADRTKAALDRKRASGWRPPGRPGARLPRATAQLVADLASTGASLRDLAAQLNAEGVPTASGGRWHPASVRRAIQAAAA